MEDFSFSFCLQGNDTTATMTSFVFLVLAIHQAEQVSSVWCTDHGQLMFTNFIGTIISAVTEP
jgi:hypothetical protein